MASRPRSSASETAPSPPARNAGGEAPLQTLARGLRILKFIAKQDQLVRLRDVAQAFGLERSIALRLLQTLEAENFIRKHEGLKAYSLGPALTELTRPKPFIERLAERIRPLLGRLTQETGQTSHLAVLEGRSAVLVEVRQATGPIVVQQAAGDAEALYCSAVGKAIYAFLPEPEQRELVSQMKFEKHTPATLLSAKQLNEEAAAIRKMGVAFDRAEGPLPLKCIAVPILNEEGRPVASVGISCVGALTPQPIESMRVWIRAVKQCGGSIEQEIAS